MKDCVLRTAESSSSKKQATTSSSFSVPQYCSYQNASLSRSVNLLTSSSHGKHKLKWKRGQAKMASNCTFSFFFFWLPRFMCACKAWLGQIENPSFITDHYNKALKSYFRSSDIWREIPDDRAAIELARRACSAKDYRVKESWIKKQVADRSTCLAVTLVLFYAESLFPIREDDRN
ncbi:hypothetical protein OIU85_005635 [Salix viminalis]|uniref:Uncharacterized protein n=1 Tax=Salix viminalis TaxID=40686 RepID=A0A9Q0STU1_SALVM|nr:hypothetical protein OIU85_005635 [Salix viminalis]